MNNLIGKKVLVTASAWFYAPDGKLYRGCWGTLTEILSTKEDLGFSPNTRHTNWMVQIGNMTIAGCQVLYAIQCDSKPNTGMVENASYGAGTGISIFDRPGEIYIAE